MCDQHQVAIGSASQQDAHMGRSETQLLSYAHLVADNIHYLALLTTPKS